jgi:hypothetical protein
MNPGSIVRCRNRDWVLLPNDRDDVYRGQTRFTISPAARRELLKWLLELNLAVASTEACTG